MLGERGSPGGLGLRGSPGGLGLRASIASWGALYPRRSVERGEKTNDTPREVPLLSVTCRTASLSPLQSYPAIKKP